MSPLGKLALGIAGAAAAVVLFLVLRPDDTAETEPPPPAAPTATAETEEENETEDEPAETEPAEPEARVFRLDVRVDEPEVERIEVERGERVVLIVRADVADHVHVHGYDLFGDVAPGRPARIAFRATIPGGVEIELEDRHQLIAQLTVQP